MKPKLLTGWIASLAMGMLWSGATLGNGLQVAPTSLTIGAKDPAAELWLRKTTQVSTTAPLNAQIRVFRWVQIDGEDRLLPTQDLILSPPFVQLDGGQQQLVRVIRNTAGAEIEQSAHTTDGTASSSSNSADAANQDEQSYRIIVDEIPSGNVTASGVQFVMHYSIPVFISAHPSPDTLSAQASNSIQRDTTPDAQTDLPRLAWSWVIQDGIAWLQVKNLDVIHAQLADVIFQDNQGQRHSLSKGLMGYALPHGTMRWKTNISPSLTQHPGTLSLTLNGHEAITTAIP
jgi:fimbrial chaperone protein